MFSANDDAFLIMFWFHRWNENKLQEIKITEHSFLRQSDDSYCMLIAIPSKYNRCIWKPIAFPRKYCQSQQTKNQTNMSLEV